MAILTKPLLIVRDSQNDFILDNDELLSALTNLNAPAHFRVNNNWKIVKVNYKSTLNSQRRTVRLRKDGLEFSGQLKPSLSADETFNVESLTVVDPDFASYTISRASLNIAEFDLTLADATTEIFGAWSYLEYDEESALVASVSLVLRPDMNYSLTEIRAADSAGQSGTEKGKFSYDSITGALVATEIISDENGEWGMSHPQAPYKLVLIDDGKSLELWEGEDLQVTFSRV